MRKLFALSVVALFVATASAAYVETFETYANQAAMDAAWGTGQILDQAKGFNSAQSITNKDVSDPNAAIGAVGLSLGAEYVADDATPLVFSTKVDVDVLNWWTRSWVRLDARDPNGGLQDLVALGFNSSNSQTAYHFRGGDGTNPAGLWKWYEIDDGSGNPAFTRTTEWRTLTAVIWDTSIKYYVDGVYGGQVNKPSGVTYDSLSIGTSYSSQEQVWFDDIRVYNIPEPASLLLIGLAGLVLRRR